jgi:Ankyrin repeat
MGHSAAAVRAFLDAGGSARALVPMLTRTEELHTLMLHVMAHLNPHPHTELAESVKLLIDAGADINAFNKIPDGTVQTALMCAAQTRCCPKVLEVFLQSGADPTLRSRIEGRTEQLCIRQLNLEHLRAASLC